MTFKMTKRPHNSRGQELASVIEALIDAKIAFNSTPATSPDAARKMMLEVNEARSDLIEAVATIL